MLLCIYNIRFIEYNTIMVLSNAQVLRNILYTNKKLTMIVRRLR